MQRQRRAAVTMHRRGLGPVLLLLAVASAPSQSAAAQCWQPTALAQAVVEAMTGVGGSPVQLPPHPRLRLNDTGLAQLNATIQARASARAA